MAALLISFFFFSCYMSTSAADSLQLKSGADGANSLRAYIRQFSFLVIPYTFFCNHLVAEKITTHLLLQEYGAYASSVSPLRCPRIYANSPRRKIHPYISFLCDNGCARQIRVCSGRACTAFSFLSRRVILTNPCSPRIVSSTLGIPPYEKRRGRQSRAHGLSKRAAQQRQRLATVLFIHCRQSCMPPFCRRAYGKFYCVRPWSQLVTKNPLFIVREDVEGTDSKLESLRWPLINVVDFASMRSPPLSTEELLRQHHDSEIGAVQMYVASQAVKAAGVNTQWRGDSLGSMARAQQLKPLSMFMQPLQNYRAVLFFTSWDTRSQAVVAALNDLASAVRPLTNVTMADAGNKEAAPHARQGENVYASDEWSPEVEGLFERAHPYARCERPTIAENLIECLSGAERINVSEHVVKQNGWVKDEEAHDFLFSKFPPAWLPIIGVRVYNSLVVGRSRRAMKKHRRMLTNRKQLRDHERALLLMMNEDIYYGAGHLPAVQIWRVEVGKSVAEKNRHSDSELAEAAGPQIATLGFGPGLPKRLQQCRQVSKKAANHCALTTGCHNNKESEHHRATSIHFVKVFEARGFGPITLFELAGGNSELWKKEEAHVLKRALMEHRNRRLEREYGTAGILSAGSGQWLDTRLPHGSTADDLRVWLAQLSTLYQYHALILLLKRLSWAEEQFPEYEEFNLQRFTLKKAKQKGLLGDLSN